MDSHNEFKELLGRIYHDKPEQADAIFALAGDAWKDIGAETSEAMEKTVTGNVLAGIRLQGLQSPYLLVQIQGTTLETVNLTPGKYSIGRHPANHIQLWAQDLTVSRIHCLLVVSPDNRITIYDLASSNGTFVNDEQVPEGGIDVQFEERIKIGEHYILTLC